ncbi:MAG TPA: hypothetical protein VKE42_06365 [Candidatus Cybelea sp.]|nr:hypothetical protein [Candidatus Cybelea sp.]
MPKDKSIQVTFAGINYPGEQYGFPYEVNRAFTLPWDRNDGAFLFEGQPDDNGIYPWVRVNDSSARTKRVEFNLYKAGGTIESDVFFAFGNSPLENTVVKQAVAYGGTATLT